jgi:hypothetical protein
MSAGTQGHTTHRSAPLLHRAMAYVHHIPGCSYDGAGGECDCGLAEIEAEVGSGHEQTEDKNMEKVPYRRWVLTADGVDLGPEIRVGEVVTVQEVSEEGK